jgi:chromosome segregation ATPase
MPSKASKPAPDRLDLEQLGELENYYDDELADVREKLIDDIARIEQENRVIDGRIKEFNRRKQELAHERAERSKAIRAVKHELSQRLRNDSPQRQRRAVGR